MSDGRGFALFDTRIGACAIAWAPGRIVGVQLPDAERAATRLRMLARFPAMTECVPPPWVCDAVADIAAVVAGDSRALLLEIVLDEENVPDFHRRVYAITRRIPPGETRTYGEIAAELGSVGLSRAVGQALGRNPFAPVVPCHRVLAADGRPGGFSAPGGALVKLRMLAIEGARPGGTASLFDDF